MNVQEARSPSASRPWGRGRRQLPPRPARADGPQVGLDGPAPLQASETPELSAPGELRGALGRLGYLCAGGAKAMFVAGSQRLTIACWNVPSTAPQM